MLYDGEVIQPKGGVAPAAGEPDDVVLPVIDKLGALLDVDVIGAHVEDDSDVAFVLQGGTGQQVKSRCGSVLVQPQLSSLSTRFHAAF